MRRPTATLIAVALAAVVAVGAGAYVAGGLTPVDQPGAILPIPAITTTAAPEGTVDDVTLDPVLPPSDGQGGGSANPGSGVSVVEPAPAAEVGGTPAAPGNKPTSPPGQGATKKPSDPTGNESTDGG